MTTYDSTKGSRPFAVRGSAAIIGSKLHKLDTHTTQESTQNTVVSDPSAKTTLEQPSSTDFASSTVSNQPMYYDSDEYQSTPRESARSEVLGESLSSSPTPNQLGRKRRRPCAQPLPTKQLSESFQESKMYAIPQASSNEGELVASELLKPLLGKSSEPGEFSDILVPSTAEQNRQKGLLKENYGSSPTDQVIISQSPSQLTQPSYAKQSDVHSGLRQQTLMFRESENEDEIFSDYGDYLDEKQQECAEKERKSSLEDRDQCAARKERLKEQWPKVPISSSPPQHPALDKTSQQSACSLDRNACSDTFQVACPKWGNVPGSRGVWVQWKDRMEIACLFGGEEVPWTAFAPKKGISLLHQEMSVKQSLLSPVPKTEVLFPNLVIGEVSPNNVKMLDLQLGDLIKIQQFKQQTFQIIHLVDTHKTSTEAIERMAQEQANNWEIIEPELHSVRVCDIGGHDYAIVKAIGPPFAKIATRLGPGATNSHAQVDKEVYAVPLNRIYLPKGQWNVYLQRQTISKENATKTSL